ncbi:MAG TPA: bifunctional phosphopantothenoylcysteine decarboxylase/phosphopantothenate--cysteine ligase CoaBC [Rhodanobacteraceae bacterium]|nr:bifunctional phosphopantothenoylcysteine decarboxylase/phosphopantothenate--cysteine ligase CoaBC [Rhodanobacteraceae bacterium]
MTLADRRIVLGISGGIAAYKACELCRALRRGGAEVRVVLTAGAEHFVTATSLQALSGQPVRSSLWDAAAEAAMSHIELARWAERIIVAPASADTMARLAHGLADDLLATICLASEAPLLLAPAMNRLMWAHPATQANAEALRQRGVRLLGPAQGDQACGEVGPGRMLEPEAIAAAVEASFAAHDMAGLRLLVSAGPTLEDIDPVRYLGNRSSGRMGFAVAAAGAARGARVTLVAGPVALDTPAGVARRVDVRSAAQMRAAMHAAVAEADIVVAAAAVADYRPREALAQKHKRGDGPLTLELVENPDILAELAAARPRPFLVGFAAETERMAEHAQAKLAAKGVDMVAANSVADGCGFDQPDNALELYWPGGSRSLPAAPKGALAHSLLDAVMERCRA